MFTSATAVLEQLKPYIILARPDHWVKQVFVLPGIIIALRFTEFAPAEILFSALIGLLSVCALASANYTINEWLDAPFDALHPRKKFRPSVLGQVRKRLVFIQYVLLALIGCILGAYLSFEFLAVSIFFLLMGIAYNVPPLRLKDVAFLDVLTESVNNPIRFLLGWFMVSSHLLPPVTILLSVFFAGAFLMAVKRYAEYVYIGNPETLALYRKSFAQYTQESLLVSSFFYALCAVFFLGIFMIKYQTELILSFPLIAGLFAWYLSIGLKKDSQAQHPEGLYLERRFITYALFVVCAIGLLVFVEIPQLSVLQNNIFLR